MKKLLYLYHSIGLRKNVVHSSRVTFRIMCSRPFSPQPSLQRMKTKWLYCWNNEVTHNYRRRISLDYSRLISIISLEKYSYFYRSKCQQTFLVLFFFLMFHFISAIYDTYQIISFSLSLSHSLSLRQKPPKLLTHNYYTLTSF